MEDANKEIEVWSHDQHRYIRNLSLLRIIEAMRLRRIRMVYVIKKSIKLLIIYIFAKCTEPNLLFMQWFYKF